MFWDKRCDQCSTKTKEKCLCRTCRENRNHDWWRLGYVKGLEKAKQNKLPQDVLKKMLVLCHPDKHGNSPVSNEVTRWLLERRK